MSLLSVAAVSLWQSVGGHWINGEVAAGRITVAEGQQLMTGISGSIQVGIKDWEAARQSTADQIAVLSNRIAALEAKMK